MIASNDSFFDSNFTSTVFPTRSVPLTASSKTVTEPVPTPLNETCNKQIIILIYVFFHSFSEVCSFTKSGSQIFLELYFFKC